MRRLVMRPEFGSGPLWDDEWDGRADICPDPQSLGVSLGLSAELATWQAEYDATLDHSYPPDSSFPSEALRVRWERQGHELLERLRQELGETVTVRLELPGGNTP